MWARLRSATRLLVCDLDGTLCSVEPWHAWARTAHALALRHGTGGALADALDYDPHRRTLRPDSWVLVSDEDVVVARARAAMPPGVFDAAVHKHAEWARRDAEARDELAQRTASAFAGLRVPVAVYTASNRPAVDRIARLHGFTFAGAATASDPDWTPKPDPAALRRLIAGMGRRPEEVCYVGDTQVDVDVARAARVGAAVAVRSALPVANADVVVPSAASLARILQDAPGADAAI